MIGCVGMIGFIIAAQATTSDGASMSQPLAGFEAEPIIAIKYRNPAEAIGVDPRFEPEQSNPRIVVEWSRDEAGHLWADVVYRNPDTGIFREKNERFEFVERPDGDWDMIGSWSRWKCLESKSDQWSTKDCHR